MKNKFLNKYNLAFLGSLFFFLLIADSAYPSDIASLQNQFAESAHNAVAYVAAYQNRAMALVAFFSLWGLFIQKL